MQQPEPKKSEIDPCRVCLIIVLVIVGATEVLPII